MRIDETSPTQNLGFWNEIFTSQKTDKYTNLNLIQIFHFERIIKLFLEANYLQSYNYWALSESKLSSISNEIKTCSETILPLP